jgi:hypothetical protein
LFTNLKIADMYVKFIRFDDAGENIAMKNNQVI